jgi:hypothetical protein
MIREIDFLGLNALNISHFTAAAVIYNFASLSNWIRSSHGLEQGSEDYSMGADSRHGTDGSMSCFAVT